MRSDYRRAQESRSPWGIDALDKLLNFINDNRPETGYLMKNDKKYPAIENAINEITELAKLCDEDCEISIETDEIVGTSVLLSIKTNYFVVDEIDKFCKALKEADTIDVSPLEDGRVEIGLTFQDAYAICPGNKQYD